MTVLSVLCTKQLVSQTPFFVPAPDDQAQLQTLADQVDQRFRKEVSALPAQNRKEMTEMMKLRLDNIHTKFSEKEICTSPAATGYLQKIVQEIVQGNPLLQHEVINCCFSRSAVPNASYLGEGLILLNMGLFTKLRSESQVAFIVCHELAHCYLHHSENSIRKYITTMNSEEVQQELRSIKKNQFNKRTDLEKLLRNLTFNSRHHSRDHESQADSLAVEFLKNTGFDIQASVSSLALLDSVDTYNVNTEESLRKTFETSGYRFQKRWLGKQTGLSASLAGKDIVDTLLTDSLKTHPDCTTRIRLISPLVTGYKPAGRQVVTVDTVMFRLLRNQFAYEVIDYAFTAGNYTKSLFYSLSLLETEPADPYLVTQTGRILNGLYTAQKKHQLGKLIDLPSPAFSSDYNILLQFIQNLYLEDYAAISYHYLNQFHPLLSQYASYASVYNTSLELNK